jgi:hypothetical protein
MTGDKRDMGQVPDDQEPGTQAPQGWDTSTMCLRVIHDSMLANGWASTPVELPLCAGDVGELPRRPPDFGVGLWR